MNVLAFDTSTEYLFVVLAVADEMRLFECLAVEMSVLNLI
jgi:tRNA A37 threonylcarbamoyladenosine modification protein TsaB